MILGLGQDLLDVARMARAVERHGDAFLARLFSEAEIAYCRDFRPPHACFAARFAAKEALFKALGTGLREGMRWRDVEVVHDGQGRPSLRLDGGTAVRAAAKGVKHVHLSVSHTREQAVAVVVLEG